MAPINERDDDLVMESTTDSVEQIAEGLGVELASTDPVTGADTPPPPVPDGTGDTGDEPPVAETPAPAPGQVSVEAEKIGAPRKASRKRASQVDREVAAAAEVLRLENETLKQQLAAAAAKPAAVPAGIPPAVTSPVTAPIEPAAPLAADGTHPDLEDIAARRTAIGDKPAQDDFDDYDLYIEAKDTWLRQQGALDAEESLVKRSVAQQQQAEQTRAQQAAQATISTFQQRREAARAAHADFDKVINSAASTNVAVARHIGDAIIQSEAGGELVYHFAKNPAELQRIQALPRTAAIMELGVIASRLTPGAVAAGRPARITRAPEPQGSLMGNDPSGGGEPDLDDPNLTLSQYNRLRDRMDAQSGRRQHIN